LGGGKVRPRVAMELGDAQTAKGEGALLHKVVGEAKKRIRRRWLYA